MRRLHVAAYVTPDQRIELLRNGGAKWGRRMIALHTAVQTTLYTRFIRPADSKTVQACIAMSEEERACFNDLGGSHWLRALLQNSIDSRGAPSARK
jgi:hypothetical protein